MATLPCLPLNQPLSCMVEGTCAALEKKNCCEVKHSQRTHGRALNSLKAVELMLEYSARVAPEVGNLAWVLGAGEGEGVTWEVHRVCLSTCTTVGHGDGLRRAHRMSRAITRPRASEIFRGGDRQIEPLMRPPNECGPFQTEQNKLNGIPAAHTSRVLLWIVTAVGQTLTLLRSNACRAPCSTGHYAPLHVSNRNRCPLRLAQRWRTPPLDNDIAYTHI